MKEKEERKNFKTRLDLACGSDKLRPVLQFVIFENRCAVCTDAHILVKQKLELSDFTEEEIEIMEGKALHKDKFKEIFKAHRVEITENEIKCISKSGVVSFFDFDIQNDKYPNFEAVIPNLKDKKSVEKIAISSKLIARLEKLVIADGYDKGVVLNFFGDNRGVLVSSSNQELSDELVLIMPLRLND